jgi:hypothetical protein
MSDYDLQKFFLIGNPIYNSSPEYDTELANNVVLSPYHKKEITIGEKKYPSLIHYLLSLRLCYKDVQQQLLNAEPDDVRVIYEENKEKCEKNFLKYAKSYKISATTTEFIKEGYANVKEYLLDKTDKSLDILYNLISNDSNMKNALVNSGNKIIVFHDPDHILGDKGGNLYGKKLQQVRKFLQSNYQRDCIAIKSLENIITLNDEKIKEGKFNDFEKWAFHKLEFLCNLIAKFFEYLCAPRDGFMKVSIPPIIVNPYENPVTKKKGILVLTNDKFYDIFFMDLLKSVKTKGGKNEKIEKIKNYKYQDKIFDGWEIKEGQLSEVLQFLNSEGRVIPRVTPQMSLYCIKEILHCGIFNTFESVNFPNPDDDTIKVITKMIKNNFENVELANATIVDNIVIRDIYQYVFIVAEYIMLQGISENTDNYTSIIESTESFVTNTKRTYFNYGFETDEENAISQFVLYIITAVMDSIDIDVVTDREVSFCIDLLNLNKDVRLIPSIENLMKNPDELHDRIIVQMFSEKGFIVDDEVAKKISNLIYTVNDKIENAIVKNRVYSYANFI